MATMTGRKTRVSVGMPVYNGENFLAPALDSILAQSFEDFELIISDNASSDGTEEICRSYLLRDKRIRYFRNETNIGAFGNFNRVFQLGTGEFFKWASADDVCSPNLLEHCIKVLDSDATIVATYAKTRFIDQEGEPIDVTDPGWHLMSEAPYERLRRVIVSGHWVNLFYGLARVSDLTRTRLFPDYAGGDCRLIGELSLRGKFYEIPDYLFFRRIHSGGSSQNTDLDWQSKYFKGRSGRIELPYWHICFDHSITILKAPLSAADKISCLGLLAHRMYCGKRELLHQLHMASKYFFGRVFTSH